MNENSVSTIGRNVALYRRALKMSAEDLAEAVGMTRSVVANLENGRKEDVTVRQLFALATALGVPPISLAIDTNNPGGTPEFSIGDRTIEEYNFGTGKLETVPAPFRNAEAMNWFAGLLIPKYEDMNPAQRLAYDALSALGNYSRTYASWSRLAVQIDELRRERDSNAEDFAESGSDGLLQYMEDMIETAAEQVVGTVEACRRAGVHIRNTGDYVTRTMLTLGFKPPQFESGPALG